MGRGVIWVEKPCLRVSHIICMTPLQHRRDVPDADIRDVDTSERNKIVLILIFLNHFLSLNLFTEEKRIFFREHYYSIK